MLKIVIFKVYLLRHLWTEVGFDYGLWIYRTISKIHRAGFFNFAFVFEIFDLELCERRYFVQTSNGCYSVTESRRVNLMVSIDRVANGLSQSINKSRVPRTTWLSRDLEHCRIATECQNRHFSKSISSAIYGRVSGLIMDYESMGQYLKFIGPDFWISLSFLIYLNLKLAGNPVFGRFWLCSNCDFSTTIRRWTKPLVSMDRSV